MEAGRMISEREARLRERAAAALARCIVNHKLDLTPFDLPCRECTANAAVVYPLPKISVPRVVTDRETSGVKWRWVNGRFEILGALWMAERWTDNLGTWAPNAERVALWADLIANPTELIDDGGSANPIVEVSRG